MIIHFNISDAIDLFTIHDYKELLKQVGQHFVESCSKQGINIRSKLCYYNPEENAGILEYLSNYEYEIQIPTMDFGNGNNWLEIKFY
jgi:hypothetical protein